MDDFPNLVLWLGVQRSFGRNGSLAAPSAGGRAGRQTRHGQGYGAAGHDEMLRARPALARVEMFMPLGLPESIAQEYPPGLQLSAPCGTGVLGVAARDNSRSNHRRFGLLLRHPPHVIHLALRLSDEQVPRLRLTKYVDDLTIRFKGMNHTVATVITEAVSSMVGWLENGLDFHVSKDEEGVEGKSVVGARHEGRLARTHPGR